MFDRDRWTEIFSTMRRNRLRAILTGLGVFWGIMMLVVLLGCGNGLENGVSSNLAGFATNAVYVWGRDTNIPYRGMKPGRDVRFDVHDIPALADGIPEIEHLAPRNQLGGYRSGKNISRGNKSAGFNVMGDFPQFRFIQPQNFYNGRYINELDIEEKRKVAVIGEQVRKELFLPEEDPVGDYIKIQGVFFKVVGVFRSIRSGDDADRDTRMISIPFTTFNQAFNFKNRVSWFAITAKPGVPASKVEAKTKAILARNHTISPEDDRAFGSFNSEREMQKMTSVFGGIRFFIWFVGIGTLLAGVIGVSNIMLISVRERTKEIGIRKAMGATPISVIALILQEAVFITALAGYLGLLAGVGILELLRSATEGGGGGPGSLLNPGIEFEVAVTALIILIVSGTMAGIIPAINAARVNPIYALRAE